MIVKERGVPRRLLALEAAMRRLPKTHPKLAAIQGEYYGRNSGYYGEQKMDHFLKGYSDAVMLRDLRLCVNDSHFQLDTLLIFPNFALILESKNISGNLTFDTEYNQLLRDNEDQTESFEDPILQVLFQKYNLRRWLKQNNLSHYPVEGLVVMMHPSVVIKSTNGNKSIANMVVPPKKVIFQIEKYQAQYKKEILKDKETLKLSRKLKKLHTPLDADVLSSYKLNEILTGVQCPSCSFLSMEYSKGKWICPDCQCISRDAHYQAVQDYFLLVKKPLTNTSFREFLHIPSMKIASHLLTKMNLPQKGAKKNREYGPSEGFL